MRLKRISVVVLSIVFVLLATSAANGELISVYNGCYSCVVDNAGNGSCGTPSNNSWGDVTTCTLASSNSGPTSCQTSGGMCYYTEVSGGGGGGNGVGGGSDNGCSTYAVGDCPADCSSCGPFY